MNDMPKNNPKRRLLVWRLCRWLFLVVGAITVFISGYFLVMRLVLHYGISFPSLGEKIYFALVNLIAVVFLGWLFHRPFCRGVARLVRKPVGQPTLMRRALSRVLNKRMVPRYLFCLACLATLLAVFYAVENWRGKRAWEKCRRELEAKGEALDWNALIPAPVPDDQNIYKAPRMAEWFVKGSVVAAVSGEASKAANTNAPFSLAPGRNAKKDAVLLAELEVVPSEGPLPAGKVDAVLKFDDPAAREQAAKLLDDIIGPSIEGARAELIVTRPRDQIKPQHLVVQADTQPSPKALAEFLTHSPGPYQVGAVLRRGGWGIEPLGSNAFRLSLKPSVHTAADYLALSQSAVPDLDLLREALKRPCARMDSDYQRPFERPIPAFVRLRTVAQMLSQRAQCYLLLGQPEAAWHELTLVRDMCRLLEGSPPSKTTTLVEAMIDVAITGLYTSIINDGLRLQAWREPELAAMQNQLKDVNLLPLVPEVMQASRAGVSHTFETTSSAEFKKWFLRWDEPKHLLARLTNPRFLFITFTPRGWMYQNLCVIALQDQMAIESFDLPNNQVLPHRVDGISNRVQTAFSHFTPYTFLGGATIPNFVKATRTLARTQTLVNEAYIACGLERYRLAHGQYPETLEALVPQFAEKLPHDIIGGQPLKYHRTTDGRFVLYSVGWNEKDDGGVSRDGTPEGDWVWP